MNKCYNKEIKGTQEYILAEMGGLVLVGNKVGDIQAMKNKCTSV
jgi:hypothetical protein